MKEPLPDKSRYSSLFNKINSQLLEWDFSKVDGIGIFKNHISGPGGYAHIKLSMYKSIEDQSRNDVKWKTNQIHLPEKIGYQQYVEKVLSYFVTHLSEIKNENVNLTFEIKDGSYHPFDTKPKDFEIATVFALINSFYKNYKTIKQKDIDYIEKLKAEAVKKLQSFH